MWEEKYAAQDVLIALCCHNHFSLVPPLCVPVQGGARLNPAVEGAIPDIGAKGDISTKNHTYCELTVLYFMWKNLFAEYYGLCHYRRFFCFDESVSENYLAKRTLKDRQLQRYFKSEMEAIRRIRDCDVLIPRPEDMGMTVLEHYSAAKGHWKEDLKLFVEVLLALHPELTQAAEEYLSQNKSYFCNMFIMSSDYFQEYCRLLFSSLEEFDRRKAAAGESIAARTDGYLGERFLGIYITFLRKKDCRIVETARIDLECSLKKRLLYRLFPPESRRRLWIKKWVGQLLAKLHLSSAKETLR